MWKQILAIAKRLLLLAEDTKQNRDEIKELQKQVRDLAAAFERLAYEVHRVGEKDEHERDKLILRVENELLKFERRLPPAKDSGTSTDKE
jgi:predicted  nucleic acid-binding Zn-ribbon protein